MTDRREDITSLADLDKRLAIVETTVRMGFEAQKEANQQTRTAVDNGVKEVGRIASLLATVVADPLASPAGRQLSVDITELKATDVQHDARLDAVEEIVDNMRGGLKAVQVVAVVLGTIATAASLIALIQ